MRYLCGHSRVVNGLDLVFGTTDKDGCASVWTGAGSLFGELVRGVVVVGAGDMW